MPDTLLEWLAPHRKKGGYIFAPDDLEINREATSLPREKRKEAQAKAQKALEDAYQWRLALVAKFAGVALPKNVLRHTAITMRVNASEDVEATALWAGNSSAIIDEHYLGVATPQDAHLFYGLRPRAGSVVPLLHPSEGSESERESSNAPAQSAAQVAVNVGAG